MTVSRRGVMNFAHDTIGNSGAGASVHQGNVGDPENRLRVVGEVIEQHGRLAILGIGGGLTSRLRRPARPPGRRRRRGAGRSARAALDGYAPPEGILVAAGRPSHGIDGFRRSHSETLLAATTEPAARLRETVLAFLAANGSSTKAAKELYVHHNTVTYRVKRAEELLGRRVTDEPIELTCALTLSE